MITSVPIRIPSLDIPRSPSSPGDGTPIKTYLPQPGAATATCFLKALGITILGSCVDRSRELNQGESRQFDRPDAVFIDSVADWTAQKYHSAAPGKKTAKGQDEYGGSRDQQGLPVHRLAAAGKLTLRTAGTYPLQDATKAHTKMQSGGLRGRLVLIP